MFQSDEEIYITVIASACLMIALVIVVVIAILKYQNRVKKHILEMITLKATYEK